MRDRFTLLVDMSVYPEDNKFHKISVGYNGSVCGLTSQGSIYCWGENFDGQLGDQMTTDRTTPYKIDFGSSTDKWFKHISAGRRHTCAISGQGNTYCWGRGVEGC